MITMEKKISVFIDPSVKIQYSSFYIKGLYDVFGKANVRFSGKYFKQLKRKQESHSYDHYMAFVVEMKGELKKYIIDFRDKRSVKESAYKWCDKYAKINFSDIVTEKCYHDKMVSIPPGFGIKIWGKPEMAFNCISNFIKCNFSPVVPFKRHLSDYYSQYRRPSLDVYTNNAIKNEDELYVFMIGTLWSHLNCIDGTNLFRKAFVDTCKSMNINFEGGFFSSPSHPQYEEFKEFIFTERYSIGAYVEKTKKSLLVFNTPAVHECHGWKLGEYLAMGKAIISSPLSNKLPEDMVHGNNIHFISNIVELKESISSLITDDLYRKRLEEGSRNYFKKYASPKAVIENLTGIKTASSK
jgi:glycosyltransferase involved in cell wall biosynthesis